MADTGFNSAKEWLKANPMGWGNQMFSEGGFKTPDF